MQKIKNYYHLIQSLVAALGFNYPAKSLFVIGVTGTDGKTTTANLIYHLLQASGYKVAVVSTIGAYVNGKLIDTGFHVTTPSGFALQRIIKQIKKEGCTHLVLEVTSHALDQNRAYGIPFNVGVITNITHEHLDYHKTIEKYRAAKLKLLKLSKVSILNKDDSSYEHLIQKLIGKRVVTYSTKNRNADFYPQKVGISGDDFNTSNRLAAIAAVCQVSVDVAKDAEQKLSNFVLPEGRQEYVYLDDFQVMVDFAHTPNSIDMILSHLRKKVNGRIIHVFGSAGDRDRTKRPFMGECSSKYADVIILTSEDPRFEDPVQICEEIAEGIHKKFNKTKSLNKNSQKEYSVIVDRGEAIQKALSIAQKNDLVLVTGKGHEKSMNIKGTEYDWSDRECILSSL